MSRPPIKPSVKKIVRQECYFGCVFCGSPIFEYDHIIDYAITEEHSVENLVLLCPTHHASKTKKILSVEAVQDKRKNPFNKSKVLLGGPVLEANTRLDLVIGSNVFKYNIGNNFNYCVVWINGYEFFNIKSEGGWILPSFVITDNMGSVVIYVNEGAIEMRKTIVDFTYISNRVKIVLENNEIVELILSNHKVEIINAKMIDKNGFTGLFINPTNVQIISKGNCYKVISDSMFNNNGLGIGVLDRQIYPEIEKPRGFGSFQYV